MNLISKYLLNRINLKYNYYKSLLQYKMLFETAYNVGWRDRL